jgi:galactokinase/mevalonate kinase-like predicted kinase
VIGTPPEVKERMALATVANVNKVEEECDKISEESAQIWTDLVEDHEMKDVQAKLREAWEKTQQASEKITTCNTLFPPICKNSYIGQELRQTQRRECLI